MNQKRILIKAFYATSVLAAFVLLYFSSLINYLIFHTFAELISIGISLTIFIIVLNSSEIITNTYLKIVGLAYLFIAILDTLHTLSYEGMLLFIPHHYYANQLWVATRFFEALVMLSGFFLINNRKPLGIGKELIISIYSIFTILVVLSIFYWAIFPECFIAGLGQTAFKIYSEYVISFIFTLNLIFLIVNKDYFPKKVYNFLKISFVFYIATEITFIQYISNYGFINLLGHYFKLIAFYFSYKALIETSIKEPYNFIFNELTSKTKELENLNSMKDRLFSIIGHDLRSPMASMKSTIDYISMLPKEETLEQLQLLLPPLKKSTLSAMELLDNLLQWSRSQSNTLNIHIEPFLVNDLFIQLSGLFSNIAGQKNIQLTFGVENKCLTGYADIFMITTILRNLISNSIKFTKPGGNVSIEARETTEFIIFSVADTGVGIKSEDINKLFSFNTNISTRGTEGEKGTGLGLVLCRDFIEKNHGKIWVESSLDEGTTFFFTLPKYI